MDKFIGFIKGITFIVACLFTILVWASPQLSVKSHNPNNVLFVLLSKEAAIHADPNKKNNYQLTLKGVNTSVMYFAERPARFSSEVVLNKFVQQWSTGSFKSDPPNAIMQSVYISNSHEKGSSHSVSYAVVLTNPHYDNANNQLTFDIQPLKGNSTAIPQNAHSDYVALFIDDVCLSCLG
jgi:hypothetical protein